MTVGLSVTYNGVNLNQLAYNISHGGWRFRMASKRGENPVVPYRDGRPFVDKYWEERRLTLPMWVVGADTDGEVPAGNDASRDQLFGNLRTLRRLFTVDRALKTLAIYDPDLTKTLEADAEVSGVVDFRTGAGLTRGQLFVTFLLPDVFFRESVEQEDVASPTNRLDTDQWAVSPDTDAEIYDATIVFEGETGGTTDPRLTNTTFGNHWVQYTGEVAAGEVLTIDCGSFTADLDGADVSNGLTWGTGRREMFVLGNGSNTLQFDSTGGDDVKARVAWKGRFW